MERLRPSAILVHHFFYPDDDVSARHFSQFAEELERRGWKVTILTSNRYCRYPKEKISENCETWRGIHIRRAPRPPWNQAQKYPRLASSLWLILSWVREFLRLPRADVVIVGSNPQFAALLFPVLKTLKRYKVLAHWCYDLYPEAILADGVSPAIARLSRLARFLMGRAYESVDLLVDIGACMRQRLDAYGAPGRRATLTPWAFVEPSSLKPPNHKARLELFDDAKLAVLYSGTMGRAHDFSLFLQLARRLSTQEPKIAFCFSCRGNRYDELLAALTPEDRNIRLAPFAAEAQLEDRLNTADVHLLSLRPGWEGVVVPSKFFGSLAVGKPVIYAGPEESAIARWIKQFEVGFILTEHNLDYIKQKLIEFAAEKENLWLWQENARRAYQTHFCKSLIMDKWDTLLREML